MSLCIQIPNNLKQFLISSEENSDILEEKIKWISTPHVQNNPKFVTEYYSQVGELLKIEKYYEGTKKEIYYSGGSIIPENEFNPDKIYEIKSFDKNRILLSDTKYIRINGLIISIIKYENGNEYKISYSYDEIKRIINRTVYINQECITKQIYCYDSSSRVAEYRDEFQTVNIAGRASNNIITDYTLSDICGNQINITNHFDANEYLNTEIALNENSMTVSNKYYYDNFILKTPYATEEDFNCTISYIHKLFEIDENYESDSILQFENKNKILPITLRKRTLVI